MYVCMRTINTNVTFNLVLFFYLLTDGGGPEDSDMLLLPHGLSVGV